MKNFVEKRVNSKTESFWDPVPNLKVKKVNVKAADDKVITAVNVDRDLFGRLLITANTRKINLKEVLRYEFHAHSSPSSYERWTVPYIWKSNHRRVSREEV